MIQICKHEHDISVVCGNGFVFTVYDHCMEASIGYICLLEF